jgi:hypothetical protein
MSGFITEMLLCEDCNYWFPVSYQGNGEYVAVDDGQEHIDLGHDLSGGVEH